VGTGPRSIHVGGGPGEVERGPGEYRDGGEGELRGSCTCAAPAPPPLGRGAPGEAPQRPECPSSAERAARKKIKVLSLSLFFFFFSFYALMPPLD